ncbi:MAG: permease of phosphate ABC transporter [Pygmaiobacter massiliensis]|nr:permease of phosphate ABC transporter [Pygmaiobacter massiliensis]
MKKLIQLADCYMQKSDWKILVLLKSCLFTLGLLLGMQLPQRFKKPLAKPCAVVFAASWFLLMSKLFCLLFESFSQKDMPEQQ